MKQRTPLRRGKPLVWKGRRAKTRKPMKIPVRPKPMITVYPDGREACRGSAWMKRKQEVWSSDGGNCVACGCITGRPGFPEQTTFAEAEIHHIHGRGMHGSKRDDRIFVNAKRNLDTRCWECHAKSKIKRREAAAQG